MKTKLHMLGIAAVAFGLFSPARAATLDDAMAGRWSGTAKIVVNWTTRQTLAVDVTIARDGTVTGTVGDAKLMDAKLVKNRKLFGLGADYVIVGKLDGDIIAAEKIRRSAVKFPLHWVDGRFRGGLQTSGAWFGGKEKMILTAGGLELEKSSTKP